MKKTNNSINVTVDNATTNTKKGDKTMKKSSKKSNKVRASKKLYFGKVNIDDVNVLLEVEPMLKDARQNLKDAQSALDKAQTEKDSFYKDVVLVANREFSVIKSSLDSDTRKIYKDIIAQASEKNEVLRGKVAIETLNVQDKQGKVDDLKKVISDITKKYGNKQDTIISSFNAMQWDVFDNAVVEIFESVGVRGLRDSLGELNANTLPVVQSFTHLMNLRANNQAQCKRGAGLVKEVFRTLAMVLVAEGYAEYLEDGARIKLADSDADYSFDFANYGIELA